MRRKMKIIPIRYLDFLVAGLETFSPLAGKNSKTVTNMSIKRMLENKIIRL